MKASYGIDGPNAIKGLLLGALALLLGGALINFFLFKLTLPNSVIHSFWWASYCIVSIFLMLLSSLYGKFVMRDKLIDDLNIQGDEKILDVGCGRGLLLIAAAKKLTTGRAIGLDIWSQNDLSNNSEKSTLKNAQIENVTDKIELITGDMTAMHFNDNSFDRVVSSMAIHNLPTKILREKAIQEINRVLKPGGQVSLLDFMCTQDYLNELKKLGWVDIQLSTRYFWQFPPVKVVTGRKPLDMTNLQNNVIDSNLVHHLLTVQFPKWKDLPINQILPGGWDNRCFYLGDEMVVRLPSAQRYADKVAKEQAWLPKLSKHLRLQIPTPLAMGNPSDQYPWPWSIYRWIPGETVNDAKNVDKNGLAKSLADFLLELHAIDTTGAPLSGQHNFYRGGDLSVYDRDTKKAIEALKEKIDVEKARDIWSRALVTKWQHAPVWVHGDISIGNLLIQNGQLSAVIDFGGICVGDPACDLVIAWTYFDKTSRKLFQEKLQLDADTWSRARGWALWKALIVSADPTSSNEVEKNQAWNTLKVLLSE